jgi:4-amino-4-deoxy-L-arabinose transferase-like glycosyltransferase
VAAIIDFLVRRRIDRRQYWTAMPMIFAAGAGGSTAWSYAQSASAIWVAGLAVLFTAGVLGLWVLFRRMNDNSSPILWFAGISVGGRLAQAAVRMAGGSRNEADAALGLFFVVVLVALGLAPSKGMPTLDPELGSHEDQDEEEAEVPAPL